MLFKLNLKQMPELVETLISDKRPGVLRRVRPVPYGLFLYLEEIAEGHKNVVIYNNECNLYLDKDDRNGYERRVLNFVNKKFLKRNESNQRRTRARQKMALSSERSSGLTFFTSCLRCNGRGSAAINPFSERKPANVWHSWP